MAEPVDDIVSSVLNEASSAGEGTSQSQEPAPTLPEGSENPAKKARKERPLTSGKSNEDEEETKKAIKK